MPHTPGPWLLRTGQRTAYIDTERDNTLLVLRPYSAEGGADFSANAALIAAAPDLLAALRAVIGSGQLPPNGPTIKAVLAAIAKAEGK